MGGEGVVEGVAKRPRISNAEILLPIDAFSLTETIHTSKQRLSRRGAGIEPTNPPLITHFHSLALVATKQESGGNRRKKNSERAKVTLPRWGGRRGHE